MNNEGRMPLMSGVKILFDDVYSQMAGEQSEQRTGCGCFAALNVPAALEL